MNYALLILLCAVINRLRGDGSWLPDPLPGRALYYCAALVGGASLLVADPRPALAWALAYLIWGSFAWGRWFDLGRLPDNHGRDAPAKGLEGFIDKLGRGNDHYAFLIRQVLFLVPALALVSVAIMSWVPLVLSTPFALAILGAYELGWRLTPKQPILTAEVITGALWGALIGGVHYVV